jgi:RIO-like serine/threonine protein kinase
MKVLRDKGGFWSPVISLVEHEGRPAILKDYRGKNLLTRGLLAPRLVRREFETLRHLEGIPGIPRAYKVLEKRAILLEFVDGRPIHKFAAGELPDEVFRRLERLVRAVHERGVVHLDLRNKKNIFIDGEGRPWLLDFANAMRRKGVARAVWGTLVAVDESALLKFKKRNFPHLLTDADREALAKHRFLRKFWIFSPRGRHVR